MLDPVRLKKNAGSSTTQQLRWEEAAYNGKLGKWTKPVSLSHPFSSSSSATAHQVSATHASTTVAVSNATYRHLTTSRKCLWPFCWAGISQQHRSITRTRIRRILIIQRKVGCKITPPKNGIGSPCRKIPRHRHKHVHFNRQPVPILFKPHPTSLSQRNQQKMAAAHAVMTDRMATGIIRPVEADHTTPIILQNIWTPPINSETLHELDISTIFKSLQLRHDLLFDPDLCFRPNLDGPNGRQKRKLADQYWQNVERAFDIVFRPKAHVFPEQYDFLRIIITELRDILASLVSCPLTRNTLYQKCGKRLTVDDVRASLDPELLIQQLDFNVFTIHKQIHFVQTVLGAICPENRRESLELMNHFFDQPNYGKALRHCFAVLEAIKLDQANNALRQYRSYLVDTCAKFEWRSFKKQFQKETLPLDSIIQWLKSGCLQYSSPHAFLDVYYAALISLVTDDDETRRVFQQSTVPYPITLQFDRRRLTQEFRFEFQNIIVIAILLMPYRHLAGRQWKLGDIFQLKQVYSALLNEASSSTRRSSRVSCFQLALHACHVALELQKPHAASTDLGHLAHFWGEWLTQNLQPYSFIYKLMYERVVFSLRHYLHRGPVMRNSSTMIGLEDDIESLGFKIKMVADLNLQIFTPLYQCLMASIEQPSPHPSITVSAQSNDG
ncbi:T-complex protein 11-domain-containing protein [Radiomyces spectabilis]|uniref:T-complex protein 11-domain-containing protein n=1 Tax=Radiomyces spectabilis TaxID=64574 RepID=UPI00221EADF1|nr:T-complex protein 11-domain-containing protein [Radiomyces spectabilis]KAI8384730.1 T-complex protein 11-domain-containing protein [Radiomyces spectabilis]